MAATAVTVIGNVELQGLPDGNPVDGNEYLHVKQGVKDVKMTILDTIKPHTNDHNNPHHVTAAQAGLGNVTNDLQLKAASNLHDVPDKAQARDHMQVYSKAETDANLKVHTDNKTNPHHVTAAQVGLDKVVNKAASDSYTVLTDTMATTKAINELFKAIQRENPPGTILHTFDPRDPGTYKLCGGVWKLIGQGRTLVGFNGATPTANPADGRTLYAEFGAAGKLIATGNLPRHSHGVHITSGSHVHNVQGGTYGAGGHNHSVSGGTSVFDYGTKDGYTTGAGAHNHSGSTSAGGAHRHQYAGDDQLPAHWGVATYNAARYDADSNGHRWSKTYWTSTDGDHSHSFATSSVGDHAHNVSVGIGGHSHSFSGSSSSVGDHGHTINFDSQASAVTINGNTDETGDAIAFNVEQPSLVCYIWQRVS